MDWWILRIIVHSFATTNSITIERILLTYYLNESYFLISGEAGMRMMVGEWMSEWLCNETGMHRYHRKTRVHGIKRSVSAQRWNGEGFDARPKLRHS